KYVGRLLDKVKELGMWNDTLVIAVSDHGHNIMDHGVMHKVRSHLYPELMDLVFIIRHPEGEYAGTSCNAYVGHHDILPTILSLTDLSPPMPLDGRNVWEWVTGEKIDRRTYMTSIFEGWVWSRDEEYAFISDLDGNQAMLFNVQADPKQHNNIADEEPEVCKKMYKRILHDADGPLPHYDTRREGHAWYEYPDLYAPNAPRLVHKRHH
ncbi:MAG: sulfatase, partial [Candidatus Bathyarchaeia archaeon]